MTQRNPPFDPNAELTEFTPDTLEKCAKQVENLRCSEFLFGIDDAGADPVAEQLYLVALEHMSLAERHFKLAKIAQMKAITERAVQRWKSA